MNRSGFSLLGALCAACLGCGLPASDGGSTATRRPRRVVTLTPSLTELAFALGAGDAIVGVSDYCEQPAAARARPRVGTFLQPSLERILALRPELVLVHAVQGDVRAGLAAAGVRAVEVPIDSVEEVRRAVGALGRALGREAEAQALGRRLDAELAAAAPRAGAPSRRALVVVDRESGSLRGLVAAGPGSYLDDLLHRLGATNVMADAPLRYVHTSAEEVIARAPEVILDTTRADRVEAPPGPWQALSTVPAVRKGRVHALADPLFTTPGPRAGEALRRLAPLLR